MVRDIAPGTRNTGYPGPNTRRVVGPTRSRTGSDRSGYYLPGTRVVEVPGTCRLYTVLKPPLQRFFILFLSRLKCFAAVLVGFAFFFLLLFLVLLLFLLSRLLVLLACGLQSLGTVL